MLRSSVVRALGTVQIMVGVFNVGLGSGRTDSFPYWLGVLFSAAGVVSLLADVFPFPCLVGFSAFVNIAGSVLSIVGIVLFSVHLADASVFWMCGYSRAADPNSCLFLAGLAQRLLRGMDITMMVMSVLQLCVSISLAVLGIRALCYRRNEEDVTEEQQPLLKELFVTSSADAPTWIRWIGGGAVGGHYPSDPLLIKNQEHFKNLFI